MLSWSFRYLLSLVLYLSAEMRERALRILPRFVTRHDGRWWYRLTDLVTAVGHWVAYVLVGPIGYLRRAPTRFAPACVSEAVD